MGGRIPLKTTSGAWATACGAARQIPELIAAHREIDQMWIAWRQELSAGQRHIQSRAARLYETTGILRAYEPGFVPGILQTHAYVEALFKAAARLYDLPENDPKDAADARMARQRLVTEPTGVNRYSFVLEANVLQMRYEVPPPLGGQLWCGDRQVACCLQ